jgi:hypothetical protein
MMNILRTTSIIVMIAVPGLMTIRRMPAEKVADLPPAGESSSVAAQAGDPSEIGQAAAEAFETRLIEIDFNGGTLEQYIDAVRDGTPDFNALIFRDRNLPDTAPTLPRISMTKVTANDAVDIICDQAFGEFEVGVDKLVGDQGTPIVRFTVRPRTLRDDDPEASTFRVYRIDDIRFDQTSPTTLPTDATDQSVASELSDLIMISLRMGGAKDTPFELTQHHASGVLLFKGTNRQAMIVDELMRAFGARSMVDDDANMRVVEPGFFEPAIVNVQNHRRQVQRQAVAIRRQAEQIRLGAIDVARQAIQEQAAPTTQIAR